MRLALCTLCIICVRTERDATKGFPYPPDTRPEGCRKYKRTGQGNCFMANSSKPKILEARHMKYCEFHCRISVAVCYFLSASSATCTFLLLCRKDFANHTVSIVIPWLAEKWQHMEGTMKAILHFTPDELVNEYIWISDGNLDSKEVELKALSSKVKVFAFEERQGLMRAKMKGVEMATAPVIVFLEAHVIPNKHWLQHILHRVVINPKALAMPVLDQIPQENWHLYYPMSPGHWRYEWNFNLVYTRLAASARCHVRLFKAWGCPTWSYP